MAIENTIYDSRTLLGVFYADDYMEPPSNYWLQFFPTEMNFTTEEIDLSKVFADVRKLAPLVVPTAQGKPIYTAAERRMVVRPAYIKPKDPVTASRMIRRAAGIGDLGRAQPLTPQQRYDAIVADIVRQHRNAIERRWEWMASEAIQHGAITLEDEAYPKTIVDFERHADLTITLGNGSRWGDNGVDILRSVEGFRRLVRDAPFGGVTNRLTIGGDVWDVMRDDDDVKELLNNNYRLNNNVSLNMGMREDTQIEYVGKLSNTLEVYVYSDYYQDTDGSSVPFMSPKDVVLTGPSVRGVRAFGAILDKAAQFQALSVFPKMWDENDPSVTYIMHQSAPLMVPVNPNNTLRARVVA
jgi:hypothetical protein